MLLTPQQAEERLNSPSNLALRFGGRNSSSSNSSSVTHNTIHRPGRKQDVPNMDALKRNQIALRSRIGERQGELAKEFSTTQARVSQLERGRDKSLDEDALSRELAAVGDVAIGKLMESLELIDGEKLGKESATGLSRIAANLSKVVDNARPKNQSEVGTKVQVVVYCPEPRKEENFKVIEIQGEK